jgi:hypothetical protein
MVYEIESDGKEEIKGLVRKTNGWPLDIHYYQPAVRNTASAESNHNLGPVPARSAPARRRNENACYRMQLWFQPLDPTVFSVEKAAAPVYPVKFIRSMVLNLLSMEYVGPEMNGFDPSSEACAGFLRSLRQRKEIGSIS